MSTEFPAEKKGTNNNRLDPKLRRIRNGLRITKVVATRAIKGRFGETFLGFSAGWDSTQNDQSEGLDLASDQEGPKDRGMALRESVIAAHILALQVDLTCVEHALANGTVTAEIAESAIRSIKAGYGRLLSGKLSDVDGSDPQDK